MYVNNVRLYEKVFVRYMRKSEISKIIRIRKEGIVS